MVLMSAIRPSASVLWSLQCVSGNEICILWEWCHQVGLQLLLPPSVPVTLPVSVPFRWCGKMPFLAGLGQWLAKKKQSYQNLNETKRDETIPKQTKPRKSNLRAKLPSLVTHTQRWAIWVAFVPSFGQGFFFDLPQFFKVRALFSVDTLALFLLSVKGTYFLYNLSSRYTLPPNGGEHCT